MLALILGLVIFLGLLALRLTAPHWRASQVVWLGLMA